jgi:hypothetical protein
MTWKTIEYKALTQTDDTKTIKICLYEDHYFLEEDTKYTAYSIKHFPELKTKSEWWSFRNASRKAKEGEKRIKSWKLIDLMFKNDLFEKIPPEDIAETQFLGEYKDKEPKAILSGDMITEEYEKKYNTITKIYYGKDDEGEWETGYRKTRGGDKKSNIESRCYAFADFETDTTTNPESHLPFMISFTLTKNDEVHYEDCLTGINCAKKFLDKLPDYSVIYYHNLGYDLNFIYEHVKALTFIKNGSMVYLFTCMYKGKTLEFRDTYPLISDRLCNFPKLFNMPEIKKEIMPYKLYKIESYKDKCPIEEVRQYLKPSEWEPFLELAKDYTDEDGIFDKLAYAKFYCDRDVELLHKGYSIFRKNIMQEFGLDVQCYLTVSSITNAYQLKKGCFEGVYKLGGSTREFIQATVKGGRCMTRRNEKFEVNEVLNDFDGVSLYPSAMYLFDGFLKGKPKKIKIFEPEKYSHYFVKIKITKINKILDFPLISVKDENGILQYKNEPTTMYVDKYALEDLVEFQGIEYDFLEGLYFDEGFNTKIKEVIKHMFDQRKKYKDEKNPIQIIYKLLMNAGYGKTIMKEHLTDNIILNKKKFNDYVYRNHNYIKNIEFNGNQYWITKNKATNNHMSYPQVGSTVLSYSKRIMNQVFGIQMLKP